MPARGFYMLAGTVRTEMPVEQVRELLEEGGISCTMHNGELKIRQAATVFFRPGFDHEMILVGDARRRENLVQQVGRITAVLEVHGIQYAYDIYDTENNPIREVEFEP